MSSDLILIAEPDGQARKALMALHAAQGVKPIGAKNLSDARRLLAHNEISTCLIAGGLADLAEFPQFIQDFKGENLIIYGPVQRRIAGQTYRESAAPAALRLGSKPPLANRGRGKGAAEGGESDLILIGASTGGISALETVLRAFPADCPPTFIVQHMREGFAEGMAARFDQMLRPRILLAQERQPLRRGEIYLAAGQSCHFYPQERNGLLTVGLLQAPPVCGHCPSVDMLFRKALPLLPRRRIAAALLTGMGNDGAEAMALLRAAGAHTVAQDENSSVVWGMPRAAIELGAVCEVLPLARIAEALLAPLRAASSDLGHSA